MKINKLILAYQNTVNKPLYSFISVSIVFFIFLPVVYVFGNLLFSGNLNELINEINTNNFILLAKSIFFSSIISLITTILGGVFAFILFKTKIKFHNIFIILILIPLFVSPYIWLVAWNDFLFITFGNSSKIPKELMYIFILVSIYTPLAMLITGNALTNINSNLEDAGLLISSKTNIIGKIVIPLIKPAIISSFILVFVFSISDFTVSAFLGIKLISNEIFTQFSAFYKHSFAVFQSVFVIAICFLLLSIEKKYISKANFISVGTKGNLFKKYRIKNFGIYIPIIFWLIITILAPLFLLIYESIVIHTDVFLNTFNLLLQAFVNTISLSLSSSIFITATSFILAVYTLKSKYNISVSVLFITFVMPAIVLGISFIKFYNTTSLNFIYSSQIILIIAYFAKFGFISVKIIQNSLKQISPTLLETANIQGITFKSQIIKILLPLSYKQISTSFIIIFIFIFSEMGISIMIYPPGTELLQVKIFTLSANSPLAVNSAMALWSFVFTIFATIILLTSISLFTPKFDKK